MSAHSPLCDNSTLKSSQLNRVNSGPTCTLVLRLPLSSTRLGESLVKLSQSIEAAGFAEILSFEVGDTTQQSLALQRGGRQ